MNTEPRKIRLIMELRQLGVDDARVLSAIERVPREQFVPAQFQDQAYDNIALPIGEGQTISQPLIVGLMTQALKVGKRMKVLEIGTGSGYQAAVLSRLCRRVYTIERHDSLLEETTQRLARLGIHNVTAKAGDGARGWPERAPFERIIVTAAAAAAPPALTDQLAVGGIMIIPIGKRSWSQKIVRVRRTEEDFETEKLWPVRFVPLISD